MSNPFFSYTNRDYESSRMEGISKIPSYSNNTWTDTNTSDPGIILLDYIHALVDLLQYYQDHNALEVYLSTAKERKNIFRLAKQLGYEIKSSKGATVDVTFTTASPYETSYIIPKNTVLSTKSSPVITYLTTEDTYVYTGQTSVKIPCVQGTLNTLTYKGTGKSSLDNSLEPKNQHIMLPFIGVDVSSIEITDNSGDTWKSTDYVIFSDENEKVFEPRLEYDNKVAIYFGSGQRGYSPKTTDTLTVSYIYNLGSKGRVGVGELTTLSLPIGGIIGLDGETKISNISVYNETPSVGGTDPESSKDIVENSPGMIKTNDRAVTLEDYETLAKSVPGVKDAIGYDIKNYPEFCLHYEVKVLIIPEDGIISTTLKNQVYELLHNKSIPPVVITVLEPEYKDIDVEGAIVIENNYYEEDIDQLINTKLNEYFSSLPYGGSETVTIRPNNLISIISGVTGVRYVDTLSPSEDIHLSRMQIAKLGVVNFNYIRRNS